jgi:hypothetical protein
MKNPAILVIGVLGKHVLLFLFINSSIGWSQTPSVHPGFPVPLAIDELYGGPSLTGPILVDLDGDEELEIVQNAANYLFILRADGSHYAGWPQQTTNTLQKNAVIGDIDGDGTLDIVARDRKYDGESYLYAWDRDGNLFSGFPINASIDTGGSPKIPILMDLNNDERDEILFSLDSVVNVIDSDGLSLPGWPKQLSDRVYHIGVGDYDGDNTPEVLCTTLSTCYVWEYDGTDAINPFQVGGDSLGIMSVSSADVDRDGITEIFFGVYELGPPPLWPAGILLYKPGRGIMIGWPRWLEDNNFVFNPCSWADLDNDDTLEIIFGDEEGWLHVKRIDGSDFTGFPVLPGQSITAGVDPAVGDIDSDGDFEIFIDNNTFSWGNSFYHVFHHTGVEVDWSPLTVGGIAAFNTIALGDLENDGSTEMVLVVSHYLITDQVGVYVFTLPEVVFEAERFPWPMHGHDPQHTFWYDFEFSPTMGVSAVDLKPEKIILLENYPNPFNNETVIQYILPYQYRTELTIYNLTGRLIKRLIDSKQSLGYHAIIWDGKDGTGREVPSGVYFYRLRVGNYEQTRKMIFLH